MLLIQTFASDFFSTSFKCFLFQSVTSLHSWSKHLIPCSENFLVFHSSTQCQYVATIWVDKMSLHNLQQCQGLRASKIDTMPGEEGGKGD